MLVRLSCQRLLAQPIPNTTRQTSQSPTGFNFKGERQLGRQHATTLHLRWVRQVARTLGTILTLASCTALSRSASC
jgi:hypothetical protein